MGHFFGGSHTEIKLAVLTAYVGAFQTALKNQRFETWYIDPFAGSGDRSERKLIGGLLEGYPVEETTVTFSGSAKRALEITPAFDHYRFADTKPGHVNALQRLASEHPDRDIQV